jgi:hypothetical protein
VQRPLGGDERGHGHRPRWLAAGAAPDYRAIARFRRRHLSALGHLFVQALALCQAAGMVKLGRVALDGTKLRANASRREAMSYARMSVKEKILRPRPINSGWPASLATKRGRAVYARRKAIVEPVFGQMSTLQDAKQLLLRGTDGARGEWLLLA